MTGDMIHFQTLVAKTSGVEELQLQHGSAASHLPRLTNHDGKQPDGQISKNLSSPVSKNIPLNTSGKSPLQARPVPPG